MGVPYGREHLRTTLDNARSVVEDALKGGIGTTETVSRTLSDHLERLGLDDPRVTVQGLRDLRTSPPSAQSIRENEDDSRDDTVSQSKDITMVGADNHSLSSTSENGSTNDLEAEKQEPLQAPDSRRSPGELTPTKSVPSTMVGTDSKGDHSTFGYFWDKKTDRLKPKKRIAGFRFGSPLPMPAPSTFKQSTPLPSTPTPKPAVELPDPSPISAPSQSPKTQTQMANLPPASTFLAPSGSLPGPTSQGKVSIFEQLSDPEGRGAAQAKGDGPSLPRLLPPPIVRKRGQPPQS